MNKDAALNLGCGALTLGGLAGAVVACGLAIQFLASLGMPATIAKIEQLRSDAAVVDPAQAEDVIGQVTDWNQRIRGNQALNDTWYAGWFIPDEWVDIEPISVPQ